MLKKRTHPIQKTHKAKDPREYLPAFKKKEKRNAEERVFFGFLLLYRWCNARAESQWIVRLADSHTYNTPLLKKVVYNLSISPDTRVAIQHAPTIRFLYSGYAPVLWFRDKVLFLLA